MTVSEMWLRRLSANPIHPDYPLFLGGSFQQLESPGDYGSEVLAPHAAGYQDAAGMGLPLDALLRNERKEMSDVRCDKYSPFLHCQSEEILVGHAFEVGALIHREYVVSFSLEGFSDHGAGDVGVEDETHRRRLSLPVHFGIAFHPVFRGAGVLLDDGVYLLRVLLVVTERRL